MNRQPHESTLEYKGCQITVWSGVKDGGGRTGWSFADGQVVDSAGNRHELAEEVIDHALLGDASSPWHTEEDACEYLAKRQEDRAKALIDALEEAKA